MFILFSARVRTARGEVAQRFKFDASISWRYDFCENLIDLVLRKNFVGDDRRQRRSRWQMA
jgi:hypothetical protein